MRVMEEPQSPGHLIRRLYESVVKRGVLDPVTQFKPLLGACKTLSLSFLYLLNQGMNRTDPLKALLKD